MAISKLTIFPNASDSTPEEQLKDINLALQGIDEWAKTVVNENGSDTTEAGTTFLWLTSAAGYGSTNTKIRVFLNVQKKIGDGVTVTTTPALGTSIRINEAGLYSISYLNRTDSANTNGLSLNSNLLTTAISVIAGASALNTLAMTVNQANNFANCEVTHYFNVGDTIRPHDDASGNTVNDERIQFRISKVG